MGENLCQLYIQQGLNNQNTQKPQKTNIRINNLMNKCANEQNRQFSKEVQKVNKHMKKCSTVLAIKEMQIKMTLRFHLTTVRMAIINNTNNNKCWQGCGEKGTLIYCW
jgi:acetyl-CoA carboxylase beta subunit